MFKRLVGSPESYASTCTVPTAARDSAPGADERPAELLYRPPVLCYAAKRLGRWCGGKEEYVKKLRIALSKKEKGEKLLERLDELNEAEEVEEAQYQQKKEQYTQLIEEGEREIELIRSSLAAKLEALKRDLERYPAQLKDLELKSKLGEIEADQFTRQEQRLRAKIDRLEQETEETSGLLSAETAEQAGGFIDISLEKKRFLRRPDWL